jgi:putative RecB family exonuclease
MSNEQKSDKISKMSYSRLDTFVTCPYRYKLQYIDGNYSEESTLVLDIGNILHKVLEIKYRNIIEKVPKNVDTIKNIIYNGIKEDTEKDKGKYINGINQLKQIYGEKEFNTINSESGVSYNDKLAIFTDKIENEKDDEDWQPIAVELPFEFVFENRIKFGGFIDRIDRHKAGKLKVIDYKSSNEVYKEDKLRTPLQMVIYALACKEIYGQYPDEFIYDFILLGEKQNAGTKGFIDRGIKKIYSILDEIEWCESLSEYVPKQTPLCYWCNFAGHTPLAPFYLAGLCQYYMLWTPENKNFVKHKEYKK